MNLTAIIGFVLAMGFVVYGMVSGGELAWFVDVPSLAIVVGGTIGCTMANYPGSTLKNFFKLYAIAINMLWFKLLLL